MEIMLSHLGIGMAYDALDGLNIHAQRLHIRPRLPASGASKRTLLLLSQHMTREYYPMEKKFYIYNS